MLVEVVCTYSFTEQGRVKLVADGFNQEIESNSFFTIRVPGFESPRSTAPTSSFEFASYGPEGDRLDYQNVGIVA